MNRPYPPSVNLCQRLLWPRLQHFALWLLWKTWFWHTINTKANTKYEAGRHDLLRELIDGWRGLTAEPREDWRRWNALHGFK